MELAKWMHENYTQKECNEEQKSTNDITSVQEQANGAKIRDLSAYTQHISI